MACRWCNADTFLDVVVHEIMCADREVTCPTCKRSVKAREYPTHICSRGDHPTTSCPLCKGLRLASNAASHAVTCSYRIVKCNFCDVDVIARDYLAHVNDGMCNSAQESCKDCGVRRNLADHALHMATICPHCDMSMAQCLFRRHVQGCSAARVVCAHCSGLFGRDAIDTHIAQCSARHSCPVCGLPLTAGHPCSRPCLLCGEEVNVLRAAAHDATECRVECVCCNMSFPPNTLAAHCDAGHCMVPCTQCREPISCRSRREHIAVACPHRNAACPTCGIGMRHCVLEVHMKWCSSGRTDQGVLGVVLDPGCVVVDIRKGSPAMRAGFNVGDVVVAWSNQKNETGRVHSRRDVARFMARAQDGDVVSFNVRREENVYVDLHVTLKAPSRRAPVSATRLRTLQLMRLDALGPTTQRTVLDTCVALSQDRNAFTTQCGIAFATVDRRRLGSISMRDARDFIDEWAGAVGLAGVPIFTEEVHLAAAGAEWYSGAVEESGELSMTRDQAEAIVWILLGDIVASLQPPMEEEP